MKHINILISVFILNYFVSASAYELTKDYLQQLKWAINNNDIKIVRDKRSLEAMVDGPKSLNYVFSRKLISAKDESFYLDRRNFTPEDSRLNVAHLQPDGSYKFGTYHLSNGKIHRATQCIKTYETAYLGRNVYDCVYTSENTCKELNNRLKKKNVDGRACTQCKEILDDFNQIFPLDVDGYEKYTRRETNEVDAFASNNRIAALSEFQNAFSKNVIKEKKEDAKKLFESDGFKKIMSLSTALSEHVRICREFFPGTMSANQQENVAPINSDKKAN